MKAAMKGKSILLIDDDEELTRLLKDYLGREGFTLGSALVGREGLEKAASGDYSLMLLDIMLPDMDGFDVLRALRKSDSLPVIMLTAKGEEVERIVGLELGADDYLPKPFNPRELVARIKAVLRRTEALPQGEQGEGEPGREILRAGELVMEPKGYRAHLAGEELNLTAIEFALLRELMGAAGRVLSRDTLLDRVRGREFESFDRSIDVHISHLRQKLRDDPARPRYIKTVRSVGYMFLVEKHPG